MEWKNYHQCLVLRNHVTLVGYPTQPLPQAPSSLGNSLPILTNILEAITNGTCHFKKLMDEEVAVLDKEYEGLVAAGMID